MAFYYKSCNSYTITHNIISVLGFVIVYLILVLSSQYGEVHNNYFVDWPRYLINDIMVRNIITDEGLWILGTCMRTMVHVLCLCVFCLLPYQQLRAWIACRMWGIIGLHVGFYKNLYHVDSTEMSLFRRYGITCLPQWLATRFFSMRNTLMIIDTTTNDTMWTTN